MLDAYTTEWIMTAFLMFMRVGGIVATAPFFSMNGIPVQVKVFFSLILTVMLMPILPNQLISIEGFRTLDYLISAATELLTGVAIGFAGQLILSSVQFAAELMSVNIGLAFASLLDPVSQSQQSLIGQLFFMLGVLVFINVEGDRYYIYVIITSFEWVPLQTGQVFMAAPVFLSMAAWLFVTGLQIAMPFILFLFILDLSFAIFARIMPQANIFFIALPLKVGVGFVLLLLVLPYAPQALGLVFERLWMFLEELLLQFAG